MRTASGLSFESVDSGWVTSSQEKHLQYYPQKETQTTRQLIPATWPEILAYYRSYVTATSKTQFIGMQYVDFNRFFWSYITTLFFKSLPHTYVQIFIASYCKDEHFFAPKMVPVTYDLVVEIGRKSCPTTPSTSWQNDARWYFRPPSMLRHFGSSIDESRGPCSIDYNMLAETTTAPPTVHILSSRSKREIRPSRDSSIINVSNAMYYIFKGFLSYRMKRYCDSVVQVHLHLLFACGSCAFFYLWPIYFSTFYLGDIFSIAFFFIHFLMDFFTAVITYQCLIEAIVCEWRWAKRPLVNLYNYMFMQGAATMLEIFTIYIIYPLDRLIDDITFFTGVIPTRLTTLNLRIVPVYYMPSMHIIIMCTLTERLFLFINLFLGSVLKRFHQNLNPLFNYELLFVPDANWGPEYSVRQMRKEYDSRTYVGSQAPKLLSRYMIHKAEAKKYTLNMKYHSTGKKSRDSEAPDKFMYEDEKKNV
ncbi:hypothetical protein ABMA28_011680 [Loxostege sticticalis]|uniref:Uncharacterized protein n=1 Tax=Loxostege sticticalis TaxID=481309 RepID=A0ABD0TK41_LOXSC